MTIHRRPLAGGRLAVTLTLPVPYIVAPEEITPVFNVPEHPDLTP